MPERSWVSDNSLLDKPSPARMYDYLLGGFHNFEVDRQAAEQIIALVPNMRLMAQVNRAFLRRAITFLVEQGIDQFLDIGSGVPTVGNVHEVAQDLNPAVRVVYIDSDPVAVSHSQAILGSNPSAAVIQADARQLDDILTQPVARRLLDFDKPLGVLLVSFLQFVPDDEEAYALVRRVRDAVAAGSYLAISHPSSEGMSQEVIERGRQIYARSTNPAMVRSRAQIEVFFDGLDPIEPGVVFAPLWRPEGPDDLAVDQPEQSQFFAGVGYKPLNAGQSN